MQINGRCHCGNVGFTFTRPADLYSRTYRIEVVLRVDGVERTIVSAELMREPEVVT